MMLKPSIDSLLKEVPSKYSFGYFSKANVRMTRMKRSTNR